MRSILLVSAFLLCAVAATLAPSASAGSCTGPSQGCPGIVCVWNSVGPGGTGARICVNSPESGVGVGGVCSEITSPDACWGQFVCIGYSTDGHYYWCKYSIEDPCHTTTECFPPDNGMVLL